MKIRTFDQGVLVEEREVPDDPVQVNIDTIHDQAKQALEANRTYLAITNPTAAQSTAQVKALTRQMQGVLRLLLNTFDGID